MAALTLPDLNAVAGFECDVAMLFPPVKNVGWLSHRTREPSGIFKGDKPGSRRAYRRGNSSEHDSGSLLAWAVPRAGEKPAGGRAVMATAENRGAFAAEILPPCQRWTRGSYACRSFPGFRAGECCRSCGVRHRRGVFLRAGSSAVQARCRDSGGSRGRRRRECCRNLQRGRGPRCRGWRMFQ